MKKRICAMALTLALAAGGLSLASDLNLTTILNFDIDFISIFFTRR